MAKKAGILSSQLYVVSSFGDVTMGGGISRHRNEGKITRRCGSD